MAEGEKKEGCKYFLWRLKNLSCAIICVIEWVIHIHVTWREQINKRTIDGLISRYSLIRCSPSSNCCIWSISCTALLAESMLTVVKKFIKTFKPLPLSSAVLVCSIIMVFPVFLILKKIERGSLPKSLNTHQAYLRTSSRALYTSVKNATSACSKRSFQKRVERWGRCLLLKKGGLSSGQDLEA